MKNNMPKNVKNAFPVAKPVKIPPHASPANQAQTDTILHKVVNVKPVSMKKKALAIKYAKFHANFAQIT